VYHHYGYRFSVYRAQLSTGKLINISRHLEVAQSVIFLRYFAGWATKINGQTMQPSIPSMQGEKYTAFTLRLINICIG